MKKNLCCGKEINNNAFDNITSSYLDILSFDNINNGHTIAGVQKKLTCHFDGKKITNSIDNPSIFIIKPQSNEYPCLPEAEFLAMQMAKSIHINTVPFGLISINHNNEYAYITKRVDRVIENGKINKLAMEDFCQLDERLIEDKYKGSYERCAKIINKYSYLKLYDLSELLLRLIFSFVIGNSDMHLKNFSLIEDNGKYRLSPAYDMLPVQAIVDDSEQFALTMCSKKNKIKREDFVNYGLSIGLSDKIINKTLNKVIDSEDSFIKQVEQSYLTADIKDKLITIINERILTLKTIKN